MLLAYNAAGEVIATLDCLVLYDAKGRVRGLVDFEAHERAGRALTAVWNVQGAVGSGTWPEWLGARAHDFSVELASAGVRPKIAALVHRTSGKRRMRSSVERRVIEAANRPPDPDDLFAVLKALEAAIGSPSRPLLLDDAGELLEPVALIEPPDLPLVGAPR